MKSKAKEKAMAYFHSQFLNSSFVGASEKAIDIAISETRKETAKEILEFINHERDKGNITGDGFSAALCLSNLIKKMEKYK